ncbi:hypothetical protein [Saccharophagus degradans]|uniref:Uncharacterized protein n=1 Tax=Saccharophagus degradans TaxID=86304 RepID=A0AAW7X637_9GAMM|nr:hypothetical protein [Saccharophagus degradans]MDO6423315.1 hypothetical protein [Saccharophagus degradans]MDO6606720.1 hypothetical protein [Saccharophagus degradans]
MGFNIIDDLGWPFFLASIGALGGLFVFTHAIYFYFRYQKTIDKKVMGAKYYKGGMLLSTTKLMMYGHYCLFPNRAKRAGVYDIFSSMPRTIRVHLISHWVLVIVFSCMLFGGGAIDYCLNSK